MSRDSLPRVIRFGTFEVDVYTGELRQRGRRVKLQEQPFRLLATLLERPGELITREELRSKLWPADTFVDFDHSLNATIRRLRDALGESAESPVFIETMARRGYRFIAPVTNDRQRASAIRALPYFDRRLLYVGIVTTVIASMVAFGWLRMRRSGETSSAIAAKRGQHQTQPRTRSKTINPDAYAALLEGQHYLHKRTAEGVMKSLESFQKAIDIDPNYALAYSGLADAYSNLAHYRVISPERSYPPAKAAANMALGLDDTLAEPHAVLGQIAFDYEHDWAAAEAEYKKALQLDPNYAIAHHYYGMYLGWAGRFDEALAEEQRGQALDPLSPVTNNGLMMPYYFTRQYDQVIATSKSLLRTQSGFWISHNIVGYAYEAEGKMDSALAQFSKAVELSAGDPDALGALGHAYAVSGHRRAAATIVGELEKSSTARYVPRFDIAVVYVGLGDKNRALDLLEQAYSEHNSDLAYYCRFDARLDSLRSDARFKSLMHRLGLPDLLQKQHMAMLLSQ